MNETVISEETTHGAPSGMSETLNTVWQALLSHEFWTTFAWNDIKVRYRRSRVGQFWITFSIAIFILGIGIFYAGVFRMPVGEYLPSLAAGMIAWHLISAIITEGCQGFVEGTSIILQQKLPLPVFPMRVVLRNMVIFAHNVAIIPFVWMAYGMDNPVYLLFLPFSLLLVFITGSWVALVLGMISARFRDVPQIVQSLMQIAFFMSPVFWIPEKVGMRGEMMAFYNPLAHFLEIIRQPLLGRAPSPDNWLVTISITVVVSIIGIAFYSRYRRRIAYWL